MSKICQLTGKRPMSGNKRSHAMNATKRRFLPNLHRHRFWVEQEKRFVTLRVSTKGMRVIDKKGIETVLINLGILSNSTKKIFEKNIKELNYG
ncbi:50S ribosomal protein L28 [Candidatus Fukatsuia anoeciicola]|uniref:50S ribosomal protein L28 n=1 Tax=Candidatus Fukatsuia anoeciicola TaxID=2994492 RepID=UPI003464A775